MPRSGPAAMGPMGMAEERPSPQEGPERAAEGEGEVPEAQPEGGIPRPQEGPEGAAEGEGEVPEPEGGIPRPPPGHLPEQTLLLPPPDAGHAVHEAVDLLFARRPSGTAGTGSRRRGWRRLRKPHPPPPPSPPTSSSKFRAPQHCCAFPCPGHRSHTPEACSRTKDLRRNRRA